MNCESWGPSIAFAGLQEICQALLDPPEETAVQSALKRLIRREGSEATRKGCKESRFYKRSYMSCVVFGCLQAIETGSQHVVFFMVR